MSSSRHGPTQPQQPPPSPSPSYSTSLAAGAGSVISAEGGPPTETILLSCAVSSQPHLKALGTALQTLAKIGKEVVLEAAKETGCVTLRCVNEAKTTFVLFELRAGFFDNPGLEWGNEVNGISIAVKVQLRNILSVFRSLRSTDRLVISLVAIKGIRHVMKFCSTCKNGVMKTHQFHYEDVPMALEAEFDRESAQHRIKARPALLVEAAQHLYGSDEVLLFARAGIDLSLSSYSQSMQKIELSTEMKIPAQDFEKFDISQVSARLLFSMRDFRAMLSFCETHSMEIEDLELHFNSPGDPILLTSCATTKNHQDGGARYTFSLIMSTLSVPAELIGGDVGVTAAATTTPSPQQRSPIPAAVSQGDSTEISPPPPAMRMRHDMSFNSHNHKHIRVEDSPLVPSYHDDDYRYAMDGSDDCTPRVIEETERQE